MTAYLARLDARLIALLATAGLDLAALLLELDEWWTTTVSKLEARWRARAVPQRTPITITAHAAARGRHRLVGAVRPFDRDDYEWGQAIKQMAARMEGSHAVWQ